MKRALGHSVAPPLTVIAPHVADDVPCAFVAVRHALNVPPDVYVCDCVCVVLDHVTD